jgi:Periplasmic copper-binding protein (NosD)
MSRLSPAVLALSITAALAAIPAEAASRAFVSSSGNDANTASGCGIGAPCRSFASAQTVVNDGGEIIALDAAGYGPIMVTKNVTITANPGFYAGIAAPGTTNAVDIATAGISVTLRGLNINSTSAANNGIVMTNGSRLSIENCVISNFSTGTGVWITTPATVRIVDSLIRDNYNGVYIDLGAVAVISNSKMLGNNNGVFVDGTTGVTTTVAISDSTVANGGNVGIWGTSSGAAGLGRVSVIRSTVSNNGNIGILADTSGGAAVVTVSENLVTGNSTGLSQGSAATLETLGNNTVRQNGADTAGTLTSVSGI